MEEKQLIFYNSLSNSTIVVLFRWILFNISNQYIQNFVKTQGLGLLLQPRAEVMYRAYGDGGPIFWQFGPFSFL